MCRSRRLPPSGSRAKIFACALSYLGTYAPDRQAKLDDFFLEPARRRGDLQFLLAGSLYPFGWSWPENVRRFEHVAPARALRPVLFIPRHAQHHAAGDGRLRLLPIRTFLRSGGLWNSHSYRRLGRARRVLRPASTSCMWCGRPRRCSGSVSIMPLGELHQTRGPGPMHARWKNTPASGGRQNSWRTARKRFRTKVPQQRYWHDRNHSRGGRRTADSAARLLQGTLPVGSRVVDGVERPKAISEYLVERMIAAGASQICMVISAGEERHRSLLCRAQLCRRDLLCGAASPAGALRRGVPGRAFRRTA